MTTVDLRRVHMIGIGGSGMSGLARILVDRGSVVSGSDVHDSRPVRTLRHAGAKIAVGHSAENLYLSGQAPTVVVTSFAAIPQDNPELVAAKDAGIAIIRRSDLLAELMDDYTQVLFAGTHGKTSSTSMAVTAMHTAGLDPSFAIGGQLNRAGTNAHHGTGDAFVAEADESDASLLRYSPNVAVVTNIEPDHLDYFGTEEAYFEVFNNFTHRIVDGGSLVVCLDDAHTAEFGEKVRTTNQGRIKVYGYGTKEAANKYPDIPLAVLIEDHEPGTDATDVTVTVFPGAENEEQVHYRMSTPGQHMVLNSAAALAAGVLAGGEVHRLAEGLSEFTGVRRRFEYKGQADNVRVYDDYAHHPTEVESVLRASRERVGNGRVIACFQPHLYSRTIEFAEEFAQALDLADEIVILEIFGAREAPVEGVTSRIILEKMANPNVQYEPDFSQAPTTVADLAQPGDLVLTLGAGTVTMLGDEILQTLEQR